MKKGLIALFAAALAISASVSFGYAPTIRPLPDITIGDAEDNLATQDRNFFVFTNAFRFDDYAQDQDTTVSTLLWSFDEWDPTPQWFTVNGKAPLHVGAAAVAAADGGTNSGPHLNPANEIRAGNQLAYFRDIILSPGTGTGPFSPAPADLTAHAVGKSVFFYVSDQTSVASAECFVKSVDNAHDGASAAGVLWYKDDTFNTSNIGVPGGTVGWAPFGMSALTGTDQHGVTSDYVAGSYRVLIPADATGTIYRVGGWEALRSESIPFNSVGTDNYVRGKFWIYAGGQSAPSQLNTIPNLRLRVNNRFAVATLLEVLAHQNADSPGTVARDVELAPSTNSASPSIYRVDHAPIAVPALLTNGADVQRCSRCFEGYSFDAADNGYLYLAESAIGTYSRSLLPNSAPTSKVYTGTDLNFDTVATKIFNWIPAASGVKPTIETAGGLMTVTNLSDGVAIDSTAVPTNRVGTAAVEFFAGSNQAQRVRVEAGKQYVTRFHITSTKNANAQCQVRPRTHTIGFAWTNKLEVGGAYGTGATAGGTNNDIAQQALPGVGSLNPDKMTPGENGGWYTLITNSPLSTDINPSQTQLNLLPGPGSSSTSARDFKVACDVLDTLSNGTLKDSEVGYFKIDRIEVRTFDAVPD